MAAVFYDPGTGSTVFRGNMKAPEVVQIDFLNSLITQFKDTMIVINSVEVSNNETIQFFMTFDDVIEYFYFGKGIGNIGISGTIFSTFDASCNESMPGLSKLYAAIGAVRGKIVNVSLGNIVLQGVITNFRTITSPEPTLATEFSIAINVINHIGFSPVNSPQTLC